MEETFAYPPIGPPQVGSNSQKSGVLDVHRVKGAMGAESEPNRAPMVTPAAMLTAQLMRESRLVVTAPEGGEGEPDALGCEEKVRDTVLEAEDDLAALAVAVTQALVEPEAEAVAETLALGVGMTRVMGAFVATTEGSTVDHITAPVADTMSSTVMPPTLAQQQDCRGVMTMEATGLEPPCTPTRNQGFVSGASECATLVFVPARARLHPKLAMLFNTLDIMQLLPSSLSPPMPCTP